jgi:sugar-specific transcriptional regulator TrmB
MRYLTHLHDEDKTMLDELLDISVMPNVPKEFTHLDKAEEELEECLLEIRKVKTHFNAMKAERKKLNSKTREKAISKLIDEIGDVFVDVFMCLPISIPEISLESIDRRIDEKIGHYSQVLERLKNS